MTEAIINNPITSHPVVTQYLKVSYDARSGKLSSMISCDQDGFADGSPLIGYLNLMKGQTRIRSVPVTSRDGNIANILIDDIPESAHLELRDLTGLLLARSKL